MQLIVAMVNHGTPSQLGCISKHRGVNKTLFRMVTNADGRTAARVDGIPRWQLKYQTTIFLTNYPLVNIQKTMENHHAINGKIHYKYGHLTNSYVCFFLTNYSGKFWVWNRRSQFQLSWPMATIPNCPVIHPWIMGKWTAIGFLQNKNNMIYNVGKTIINHPPNHHFYRWYTPIPVMGG
jgi:hypothetical protein